MTETSMEQADDDSSETKIAHIINAASQHNIQNLQRLIDTCVFGDCKAVDVQDPLTGNTPLHAAIASCGVTSDGKTSGTTPDVGLAEQMVRLLLENGAIWNQLNSNDLTPGCLAFQMSQDTLYQLMVDAGVRAEMLMNRLDEYEQLADDDHDKAGATDTTTEAQPVDGTPEIVLSGSPKDREHVLDASQPVSVVSPTSLLQQSSSTSNATASAAYLSSALALSDTKILDEQKNGVMMKWEQDIMRQSADVMLPSPGLRILNIGFGLGIIDSLIQSHMNRPAEHHIIEAHPDILRDMEAKGWTANPGVFVHAGKWQDILPTFLDEGMSFDAIYYDTFAESYKDFKCFFNEYVLGLLESTGRWSYFNGMGADRQISYDVYQKIVEIDLLEAGYDVQWTEIELPRLNHEWEEVRRKYWDIEAYRLPACRFLD